MIEVHLYGLLRRYAAESSVTAESIARVAAQEGDTVDDILRRMGVDPDEEVSHIFINGRYSYTARQALVQDGARLGVFPWDMGLLYV